MSTMNSQIILLVFSLCSSLLVVHCACPAGHKLYPARKDWNIGQTPVFDCDGVCKVADPTLEMQRAADGQQACCCKKPAKAMQFSLKEPSERVPYEDISKLEPQCQEGSRMIRFYTRMPALKGTYGCAKTCSRHSRNSKADFAMPQVLYSDRHVLGCCCSEL